TPIVTLAAVSGLDQLKLSTMAGHQLPWVSMLVPFWLVVTFVKMEGGTFKQAFEVWPCALVCGLTFASMQYLASGMASFHLVTDVVAGVFSIICTALFLRFVWHPKTRFLLKSERSAAILAAGSPASCRRAGSPLTGRLEAGAPVRQTIAAWTPWAILILCCA